MSIENAKESATNDEILTLAEAAAFLHVSERTIIRQIAAGKIEGFQVGNQWRFVKKELLRQAQPKKQRRRANG